MNMKYILLINVKVPIIIGILTFINRINTTSESFKPRNIYIFSISVLLNSWNFMLCWVEHEKCFVSSWFLTFQISQLVEDVQRLQASLKKLQETTALQVRNVGYGSVVCS